MVTKNIRLAIQMYGDEPLGYSLTNTITPEVLRCFFLLRELFDSLYQHVWLLASNPLGPIE